MFFGWLKRYLPRGLYGRAGLILLVPVITVQLVVSVVFIQRHFNEITRQMTGSVALELAFLEDQVIAAPSLKEARGVIARLAAPLALSVALPGPGNGTDRKRPFDFTGGLVARTLREYVGEITAVDLASTPKLVELEISTPHGPMKVSFARARVSASNPHQLLVLMVAVSAVMTLVAFLFLRNQLRPIARLGRVAEAFGRGQVLPYRLSGATEVRAAGRAFLDMRARIERQIEQRTLMLSGVSHDLRTPLTRLRLGLSMLEDSPERAALEQDVTDMERLVDEFLSFARSDALEGETESVDPAELVRRLAENAARAGQVVEIGPLTRGAVTFLRPVPVMRALENLLGNAARYGSRVRISVEADATECRFIVEDDGPGIAAHDREQALKPFARLDVARNQNKGSGVGLGLAIANDIARSHGGQIRLGESGGLGGLKVEFILPR
jgi:two-component system osmolarity sensor histidine kinase EnvZ